jgi:hypothetical protein
MSRRSTHRQPRKKTRLDVVNEVLRPNPYLGYAEDAVGVHLFAVWANPYEPQFKVHLARSLCEQRRVGEAVQVLRAVLQSTPGCVPAERLLERCERDARAPTHHMGDRVAP